MEIEGIYLHGGAKGFSFINDRGTQAEYDSFFRRFYDKITKAAISIQKIESVSKSFIIESQPINGKQFYDYTFMEHYVYDISGRASYFGITIRLNTFYCEISDLYFILDTIFKKDIIGNLLLPKELTYMCTKEQIDKPLFEMVMNDIVQLSSIVLRDSNLRDIRSAYGEKGSGVSINLIDCQPKFVENAISQYERLTISTDAPLQRESQSRQEINNLQEKYTDAVNSAQGLNDTILTLQEQLSQAQNELRQVHREFNEYKSKNKLNYEVINGLKEEKQALLKLANFVDSLGILEQPRSTWEQRDNKIHGHRDNNRNGQEKKNNVLSFSVKPYLSYIICAVVLAIIFFSLKDCSGKNFLSFAGNEQTPVIEVQPNGPNPEGSTTETVLQANGSESFVVSEDVAHEETDTKIVDINTLTIDVAEFTVGRSYMTVNTPYTLQIYDKNKHKQVEGIRGSWKIKDRDFYISNPDSTMTIITPIRSGEDLEIQFFVEGYETPLKRKIVVK